MFEQKTKEPLLSQSMQDIINNSTGDNINNCNTDEIIRYKTIIMKTLTSNQDILHTLHHPAYDNEKVINGDLLRDVCIFDYLKLPDNKEDVKNYICFDVNDNSIGDLANKNIVFRAVSHNDDFITDWGISRHDLLGAIIKNEFDWSSVCGMHLEKQADNGYITDDGYCYREIVYKSTTPNNPFNKVNNRYR